MTAAALPDGRREPGPLWGRTFLHPALDYALIGGGLSLVATAVFYALPGSFRDVSAVEVAWVLLVTAMINVHYFVVDAFIWRVRRDGRNRRIVEAAPGTG